MLVALVVALIAGIVKGTVEDNEGKVSFDSVGIDYLKEEEEERKQSVDGQQIAPFLRAMWRRRSMCLFRMDVCIYRSACDKDD